MNELKVLFDLTDRVTDRMGRGAPKRAVRKGGKKERTHITFAPPFEQPKKLNTSLQLGCANLHQCSKNASSYLLPIGLTGALDSDFFLLISK